MNQVTENLKKARTFVAKGWNKKFAAKDKDGNKVAFNDPKAVRWCAIGALLKARDGDLMYSSSEATFLTQAYDPKREFPYYASGQVTYINDELVESQFQALKWFDAAIALSEQYQCTP